MQFLRASNLSATFQPDGGSFNADGQVPCRADDREAIIIDDDMAVLDDGRLVIFGHENRTAGEHDRLTFSAAEYCIDRVSVSDNFTKSAAAAAAVGPKKNVNATATTVAAAATVTTRAPYSYVALVCRPCSRIACVPKCCAKGFMLEYKKNNITGCRKAESAANADAAIRLKAANGTELRREFICTLLKRVGGKRGGGGKSFSRVT